MISLSISIVIPVYNEEGYLLKTLGEIYEVLRKNFTDYEVIFVDDGSTDNSLKILVDISGQFENIKVLCNNSNLGRAEALKKGFCATTKEVIFYIDADLPFDPSFVIRAIPFLSDNQMVIGNRDRWDNMFRKTCSLVYNLLIRRLFNLTITDINVGAKVFKKNILDRIELRSRGSFIDAEFILEAKKKGFSIKAIPCVYHKRVYGYSKMYDPVNIGRTICDMANYFLHRRSLLWQRN